MSIYSPVISLKAEDLANVVSLQRPGNVGHRIAALVPELLGMVAREGLLEPSFVYQKRRVVGVQDGVLHLHCRSSLRAPLVVEKLPEMKDLVIAVCTIGAALGQRVNEWFTAKKGLSALVLDEIGNAAVSKVAAKARHKIRTDAARCNLDASSSLSPGAPGFESDQQQVLCNIASADKLGVEVSSGAMMKPGKSLSFVVGLGSHMPRWTQADECQYCRARQRCPNRVEVGGAVL